MATAKRIRRISFNTGRIIKRNRAATTKALNQATQEMTTALQKKINKQGPPASRPGQPPRKRTGFLHDTVNVLRKGRTWAIQVAQYGIFLDGGTRSIRPRPWIRTTIHDKKKQWTKRINTLIKQNSKAVK